MSKKKWTSCLSMTLVMGLIMGNGAFAESEKEVPEENSEDSRILYQQEDTAFQMQRSLRSQASDADAAKNFLETNKSLFDMQNPSEDFKVLEEWTDDEEMTHVRLQQLKDGVPVEGHQVIVHFNEENRVQTVNGHFHTHIDQMEMDTDASVSENQAFDIARNAVSAPETLEEEPTSELVVYPLDGEGHLVYKVNINYLTEDPGNWFVFVDAMDGEVLDKYDTISDLAESAGLETEQMSNEENNQEQQIEAFAAQSPDELDPEQYQSASGPGIGVHGDNRVLNISHKPAEERQGRTFSLLDFSVPDLDGIFTYDFKHQWPSEDFNLPGVPYSNVNAAFNFRDESHAAAVDAHYNSTKVYEYFLEEHDRNSIDDEGMALVSTVHYGEDFGNAFWNGNQMTYGDGDGEFFIPLSAGLDVAAHEITHGVTTHTAGLVYRFQSGAVNEAMSDIFGVLVDDSSWHVGEDVMAPAAIEDGRFALRSLEDPGQFEVDEDYWEYGDGSGGYPSHMDEYYDLPITLDRGGVHTNSSIINHAAYLIGQDIGREDLGQITYRALTTYLAPLSDFDDTRFAFVQSAIDLYGEDSEQTEATRSGFDGVGIE
ncbi:Zn-dependent metalloprotease [Geomicrobium halophilum]|uniref:Neutral metalloproteinase n=1 Tax=Geomicrobium halophilum TaxID=549000 RepID=A0A841PZ34_9BACL|nr:M4 family metallopeptidase [Geomicrobium halophilum]MBB6450083.1 Zn-dependent metalloprotease [Geomicrobium halophilum]